jgi:hypothetical protein
MVGVAPGRRQSKEKRNEAARSARHPGTAVGCASEMLFYEMNRRRVFDALTTIVNRANTAQ